MRDCVPQVHVSWPILHGSPYLFAVVSVAVFFDFIVFVVVYLIVVYLIITIGFF